MEHKGFMGMGPVWTRKPERSHRYRTAGTEAGVPRTAVTGHAAVVRSERVVGRVPVRLDQSTCDKTMTLLGGCHPGGMRREEG